MFWHMEIGLFEIGADWYTQYDKKIAHNIKKVVPKCAAYAASMQGQAIWEK